MNTPEDIFSLCAWCGKHIPDDVEVFSMGGKARPNFDMSRHEGGILQIEVGSGDKVVSVFVPTEDSSAKADGNDFLFMTCSLSCTEKLEEAMLRDKNLGDALDSIGMLQ